MIDHQAEREARARLAAAYKPAETAAYLEGLGVAPDRARALQTLIGWARGDHICKRCRGTGELGEDPDDYTECPDCHGEGEVEIS